MDTPLKLIKIGNSVGIVFPKALLQQLNVELGDTLYARGTDTEVRLTAIAPDNADKLAMAERIMNEDKGILRSLATAGNFEDQIEVAREVMERRKDALRALAKK
jgi:putative addiction module antidote